MASYFTSGNAKFTLSDYQGAIDDYSKAIEIDPQDAGVYFNRGIAKSELSDYKGAIEDYSKAIEIDPQDAEAYVNRGAAKSDLSDYKGAIEDYSKAIEINPQYAKAYVNRGNAKSDLSDYKGAMEDYSKAIEINPQYAKAYLNRGIAKFRKSDTYDAIKDWSVAIKNNPNDAYAYYCRGIAHIKIKKRKDAAEDFKKAGKHILSLLITKNEEPIDYTFDYDGYFEKATKDFKGGKIEDYENIYITSLKIKSELHIKDKDELEMLVSHYTRREVSEILLFDGYPKENDTRNYFHLNSLNTSNDPEEGKTLFRYLFPNEKYSSIVEDFGAFAGCFILNSDSLNQFRLYGKTENNKDGTGVSISLNENFFSEDLIGNVRMNFDINNRKEDEQPKPLPLFRCVYIDPETYNVISLGQREEYVFYRRGKSEADYQKYKIKIDKIFKKIRTELRDLKDLIEAKKLDPDVVYKLLLDLRYLVKHVAFKEEQECRIIQINKLNDKNNIKLDNKDGSLYVEYLPMNKNNVSEICFGPKAKDIDKFKQHLARNDYHIVCDKSKAPFA
ncbi:MAG: tetratricopeptide repeat protein [Chitinispirillales bacterium]|nr:tetratricopeptide repeat protein [Chitinispirillales bacterium]